MYQLGFVLVGQYQDYVFVKEGDPALERLQSKDGWKLIVVNPEERKTEITTNNYTS